MKSQSVRTTFAILLAGMLFSLHARAAVIILQNGARIEGTEVRAKSNGDIILKTPKGDQTFTKGTYAKVQTDRPAALDNAIKLAREGQYDNALQMLETIAADYRFLEWDNTAIRSIAQIQSTRGNHKDAVDAYERLYRQSPDAKNDPAISGAYQEALLQAGQHDKLKPMLDEAISNGTRADAAKAQILRGDIRLSRGETEAAVMDYLRTATLFESETAVHPEALFKAGEALEKLRDARAKDMYRRLVEKYPQSEYAQKARGKF